ncbi:hypothetical protein [Actinokineospora cianjurensis]|uniref:hypothetical protein n=1 Tax=Actinokineospora cianjurensis TaxID=585224 RepID=UPI002482AE55|nr:hypothetical protein [Actinokineospora cianjurensis]
MKSSTRPSPTDQAQGRRYCHRLRQVGVDAQGAVLHYPATRRTRRDPYTPKQPGRPRPTSPR